MLHTIAVHVLKIPYFKLSELYRSFKGFIEALDVSIKIQRTNEFSWTFGLTLKTLRLVAGEFNVWTTVSEFTPWPWQRPLQVYKFVFLILCWLRTICRYDSLVGGNRWPQSASKRFSIKQFLWRRRLLCYVTRQHSKNESYIVRIYISRGQSNYFCSLIRHQYILRWILVHGRFAVHISIQLPLFRIHHKCILWWNVFIQYIIII